MICICQPDVDDNVLNICWRNVQRNVPHVLEHKSPSVVVRKLDWTKPDEIVCDKGPVLFWMMGLALTIYENYVMLRPPESLRADMHTLAYLNLAGLCKFLYPPVILAYFTEIP